MNSKGPLISSHALLRRSAALAACLALLVSCGLFQSKPLPLPPTPSIAGDLGWLVVKESYSGVRSSTGASAALGHLRDATVLEVLGRDFGPSRSLGTNVLWYLVRADEVQGWVSSEDVEVFDSKEQALGFVAAGKKK